jgi:hypothetical protein
VLDSHRQVTDSRRYSHLGNNTVLGFSSWHPKVSS